MIQAGKKLLIVGVIAWSAGVCAAGAEGPQTSNALQPQGLNHAGVYALRQLDPDLTGTGVKFAVVCRSITYIEGQPQNDYRPNIGHNCLQAGRFRFHNQTELPTGISAHSTAVCSILFGEDPCAFNPRLGPFHYQGVAPQAQAEVYEFWHFLINNVFPHSPPEADVISVGVGNPSEDWWTRGIQALAEHYGLTVVAGIGNGLNANDPVLYPAAAADVIGVGVVDSVNTENLTTNLAHFALAYPEHSSFGPTGDGRCKPDLVAAGNYLAADAAHPDLYKATGDWSSFATPVVAGTVGLLVQKARQDPALGAALSPEGGNCVMKAILLSSAKKLPFWHKGRLQTDDDHCVPLDYVQGAGMLNALGAYEQLIAGQSKPGDCPTIGWDNNLLDKIKTPANIYKITLTEPIDKFITATVVWNRHYNSSYPFEPMPEKDANLRLELWAIDANDPNNDYLLDYSDSSVDNVEHIYIAVDANYTNYELVVSYSDTDNPKEAAVTQRYGLAWNTTDRQDNDSIFWYDLNADGLVNDADLAILLGNLLSSPDPGAGYLLGDINSDGAIDVNDLKIFMGQMNRQADWYTE